MAEAVHPIRHRVRSVLIQASTHDEVETRRALDTLADMYGANKEIGAPTLVDTKRARNHLDEDTRKVLHSTTSNLIAILRTVDESLLSLSHDVGTMQASCDLVHQRLDHAAQSTTYLVEHAEGLSRQRDACQAQAHAAQLFLQRFTLSDVQRSCIQSRELRVGQELFDIMDKLARIRTDCQVLLQGSESTEGATRAGISIMKSTTDDLEQCYQKLYKWCSFEFRQPIKEGLEVSSSLRQAVFRLKSSRQDLLRSALATLVQTRSSILANAFVTALTIGAGPPTHLPGPIELHAHDPLRYVGDMLAWIHQTVASEREFLTSLFGEQEGEGGRRIGQRRRGLEGSLDLTLASDPDAALLSPGEALVREVLNQNLEGCCRPLKIRVQQTVRSQEGSVTTYRLSHLVQFYRLTMQRTVGSRAVLSKTLAEMAASALDAFVETLRRQASGLQRYNDLPDADLTPPAPLLATMATLKELLGEYSRSLAEDQPAITVDKPSGDAVASLHNFAFVLNTLVDPMVDLCDRMAAAHVTRRSGRKQAAAEQAVGPRWESLVFVCNCLEHLASLLADWAFAQYKVNELHALLQSRMAEMSEMHYQDLLQRTGLLPVYTTLQQNAEGGEPLSRIPGATPQELTRAFTQLETFLTSDDLVISPTPAKLAKLYSPKHRNEVSMHALARLADAYGVIVDAVMDARNKYEWKDTLVRRSRDEIRILLGL